MEYAFIIGVLLILILGWWAEADLKKRVKTDLKKRAQADLKRAQIDLKTVEGCDRDHFGIKWNEFGIRKLNIQQGTAAWRKWRETKINASDAAIIMQDVPEYFERNSWEDIRMRKNTLINSAMRHGNNTEPYARHLLNIADKAFRQKSGVIDIRWSRGKQIGPKNFDICFNFHPACVENDNFGASLDGIDEQRRIWLEIKAPYKGKRSYNWDCVTRNTKNFRSRIPSSHWWQLVHQALCLPPEFEQCLYAVCIIDEDPYKKSWDRETGFPRFAKQDMEFSPERRFRIYCIPIQRSELEKDVPALRRAWRAFLRSEDSDDAYTARRSRNMLEGETVRAARDRWRSIGLCRNCGDSAEGADAASSGINGTECRPCYERRRRRERARLARSTARDS